MNRHPRRDTIDLAKAGRKGRKRSPWNSGPIVKNQKNLERHRELNNGTENESQ